MEDHGKRQLCFKVLLFHLSLPLGLKKHTHAHTHAHKCTHRYDLSTCVVGVCVSLCGGVRTPLSGVSSHSCWVRLSPSSSIAAQLRTRLLSPLPPPSQGRHTELTPVCCDIELFLWLLGTEPEPSDFHSYAYTRRIHFLSQEPYFKPSKYLDNTNLHTPICTYFICINTYKARLQAAGPYFFLIWKMTEIQFEQGW